MNRFAEFLNLRRQLLDENEVNDFMPLLTALSVIFVAISVAGLAGLAHWGLLEIPLRWSLLYPLGFTVVAVASRRLANRNPRGYFVLLIYTCAAISVAYIHIIKEPVGSIVAFMQPIYYAEMVFFSTPLAALGLFAGTLAAIIGLRYVETIWALKAGLSAYPAGTASMIGVVVLLSCCFAIIWLLTFVLWKQKQRNAASQVVLDQAYQDLRVLERSRSEMLASVTHELKTPLVTVRGYIDLALRAEMPAPIKSGLQTAKRNALRLQRLIEELLIAADPQKLGVQIEPCEVRIHDLLEEEISNFTNQSQSQDVTIVQVKENGNDTIWADRERTGQVVSNLISNALRYSPSGGVIEVGARRHSSADMLVWVTDQGKGIAPEKLKHLFEDHYVRGTDTPTERGMGLGLLICKKLVTAMGGRISVESQSGVGSTFSVTFPLKPADKAASAEQLRKPRALVLDDEPDVLALMEYHLTEAGFEIAKFQNGTAAFDRAMQEDFDIIFLDVNVPGLTGVEVSRRLREAGRPGRILLFSALIRNDAERLLAEARADGFLPKPFDFDQMAEVLSGVGVQRV